MVKIAETLLCIANNSIDKDVMLDRELIYYLYN